MILANGNIKTGKKKSRNRVCTLFPDSEEEVFFEKIKSATPFTFSHYN